MFRYTTNDVRTGTIDDLISIKATPGVVEIRCETADGKTSCLLKFPSAAVDDLIARLEAARDAAALMAR